MLRNIITLAISTTIFIFISLAFTAEASTDSFNIIVKIYGIANQEDVRLTLTYTLDNGDKLAISDNALRINSDRNHDRQFEVRFTNLRFPSGHKRGFIYGDILDKYGKVIMQIPLTQFDNEIINERGDLYLTVKACEPGEIALQNSYPPNDNNLINEENVDFVLNAIRILIEKKYVTEYKGGWERIYQIFIGNVGFFNRASATRTSKILVFLEGRYNFNYTSENQNTHFAKFYANFLNTLMLLNIDGLEIPGSKDLLSYIITRYKTMLSTDAVSIITELRQAANILYEKKNTKDCIDLTSTIIKSLSDKREFIGSLQFDGGDDRNIKAIMKLLIDSNQLDYILASKNCNASIGDLNGGLQHIKEHKEILRDFAALFELMEENKLFRLKYKHGTFRDVYEYYELITES